MLTEEQANELGKRAVAAGWQWQAGAVDACGWRCVDVDTHGAWGWARGSAVVFDASDTPDFRDPATLGILLAQVRKAWDEEGIYAYRAQTPAFAGQWSFSSFRYVPRFPRFGRYSTEAEALVVALEKAKEHKP